MTDIQKALTVLREQGWTHAAIAKELGFLVGAVDRWWAGNRAPRASSLVLGTLERLAMEEPPKKWGRKPVP